MTIGANYVNLQRHRHSEFISLGFACAVITCSGVDLKVTINDIHLCGTPIHSMILHSS